VWQEFRYFAEGEFIRGRHSDDEAQPWSLPPIDVHHPHPARIFFFRETNDTHNPVGGIGARRRGTPI